LNDEGSSHSRVPFYAPRPMIEEAKRTDEGY